MNLSRHLYKRSVMNLEKRQKWLMPNRVCIAKGDAVALNLMFETKSDHKLFIKLWETYLGGMTRIINYNLASTGWTVLFSTKSSEEISSSYRRLRKKSRKAKRKNQYTEVHRMLSEHFRIFLSQYVRRTNAKYKRKGTLVMQSFKKYVLDKYTDYKRVFELLTMNCREKAQEFIKYQADERGYDVKGEMEPESVWKVKISGLRGIKVGERALDWIERHGFVVDGCSILRKFKKAQKTLKFHRPDP